jgi:hypothetical protein
VRAVIRATFPSGQLAWVAEDCTLLEAIAPYVPTTAVWDAIPIPDDRSDRDALREA